jgi:histidinol phosphatase-like PHP family hydrolase
VQAEGREWMEMVSQDTVKLFDYVFTDAMTWTDSKGRRTRLWIDQEVWIEDENEFMEDLVGQIEKIFSSEPVHIYVNPTFLPKIIQPKYDELWTETRINRVLDVLEVNSIALEINARYHLPSKKIIKMAKARGIKFTMGTNNVTANLGTLDYCLDVIETCNLKPSDFWKPE